MSVTLPAPTAHRSEPDWLERRRAGAHAALDTAEWPTVDEEVWRYSPIAQLDPTRFAPSEALVDASGLAATLADLPPHAGGAVLVDGWLQRRHLDAESAERGVYIGRLAECPDGAGLIDATDPGAEHDVFALAAVAHAPDPILIRVPDGVVVDRPLVVVVWSERDQAMAYSEVIVDLGRDAEATVLVVEASSTLDSLHAGVIDARVGSAGRLKVLDLQQLGAGQRRIATHRARVADQASLTTMQVALGGAYVRTRSDCRLVGRGASGDLLALYFGTDDQVLDFRTFQDHEARDTTSNLLFKGAVAQRAHSVYTGLIRVHPDAAGTNAFQTNRNLKLGEHAWADSVPNLEIENNDVRCSHASTVGPIDEEQRFYLESRGVPPEATDRLIVAGFFEEVLARLPVPELADGIRTDLARRLAAIDLTESTDA